MATLAESLVASSARKLTLKVRPDLSSRKHRYQGRTSWVVKEPLGLNYFRFKEEEYAILNMLDGNVSLEDIKERFEAEFPPQKITLEELQHFIGSLHRSGLVVASVPGQGKQLLKRRNERRRKELLGRFTNVLAIRFRGIDPERILNWLHPWARWMYHPAAVACCMLFALSALLLVMIQWDVFQSRLPGFHQFFSLNNAWVLVVALAVTKVIHEFGHGLTCKHFGGECHEMGVLILVLTPCLYCNVSDSWLLRNKWHRAAIGVGGMYIEVIIASICTYLWWFSEPGLLNQLCLSTMFVCSVSTVVFNANPLLRYDGYYILSDIVEIPNLRQKSSDILNRKLGWWCLGIEPREDPFLPQRNHLFFASYSVAAAVYRWVVVFSILWFLTEVFRPYRLEIIGNLIGMMSLYGLIGMPLYKLVKFFWVPGRVEKVKKPRMFATLGLLAGLVAFIVWAPLPYDVICPLEVDAYQATPVYVDVPGAVNTVYVQPGVKVEGPVVDDAGEETKHGSKLAQLSNIDVDLTLAELEGQLATTQAELDSLEQQVFRDREVAAQIPQVKETLRSIQEQLEKKETDRQRLSITAPKSGTVIPPPVVDAKSESPDGKLPQWSGTPFDEKNKGCVMTSGQTLCLIGDPNQLEAMLAIDQADIEFVQEGDEVEIKIDELPGDVIHGVIDRVDTHELKVSPRQLSNKAGGELATKTDKSGVERPQSATYQAYVRIDVDQLVSQHGNEQWRDVVRIGARGRGKIHAGHLTIGFRIYRWLSQTFRLRQ